jgi:hypothetical protein
MDEALHQKSLGHITWKQYDELKRITNPEVKSDITEYRKEFDKNATNTSLSPEQQKWYAIASAKFAAYATEKDRSDQELRDKQKELLDDVKTAVAGEATEKIFKDLNPYQEGAKEAGQAVAVGTPGYSIEKEPTEKFSPQQAHDSFADKIRGGQLDFKKAPDKSKPLARATFKGKSYVFLQTDTGFEWFEQ